MNLIDEPSSYSRIFDKKWFWVVVGLGFFFLYLSIKSILAPFLVALFIGYLCNPIVNYLENKKIGRGLSSCLVIMVLSLLLAGFLILFVPMLQSELIRFIAQVPKLLGMFNERLAPKLTELLGQPIQIDSRFAHEFIQSNMGGVSNMSVIILQYISQQGAFLIALGFNLLMIPIILFYALRDWKIFVAKLDNMIPRKIYSSFTSLIREMDELLSQTVRGQLLVIVIQAFLYAVALWIAGLQFAFAIGLITGILSIIPYIGFSIGMTMAILAAIMQFDSLWEIGGVLLALGVVQVFESFFLTPTLVGERMGLHPVWVIFSLLAFAELFGFTGILVALPVTSLLVVLLRHLKNAYLGSLFYRGTS